MAEGDAMRVLMVLCDLRAGGAEMSALQLVRKMSPMGYDFTVAAVKNIGVLGEAFTKARAEVHTPIARFRFDPLAPLRIRRLIRSRDIEVVILVDAPRNATYHALIGARLAGVTIPKICWCKSIPGGQAGNFAARLKWFQRRKMLDAIVCTSRLQQRKLAAGGLLRRRMPLIRNGVAIARSATDTSTDLSLPKDKHIFVQVANVMPDKDFETLLAAARRIADRRDDFCLVLVGRDTDSEAMLRLVKEQGLEGCVLHAGHRDDIPAILSEADVFVLSTRSEVFNVATIEAMAAGKAIVVSDIPAFDEMLTNGLNAIKVPPGNADLLAAAMEQLMDDRPLREKLASAAGRRGQRFSLDRMANNFARLLKAAVSIYSNRQ